MRRQRIIAGGVGMAAALLAGVFGTVTFGAPAPPAAAAPTTGSCGGFTGYGPTPDCSYSRSAYGVRVTLHNNGIRPTAVVCSLRRAGLARPIDSVSLGPRQRGSVGAAVSGAGRQTFLLDCDSAVPAGKEVSRHASFTVAAAPRTAPSRTRQPAPAPRLTPPTRRAIPRPPTTTAPTRPPSVVTPPVAPTTTPVR